MKKLRLSQSPITHLSPGALLAMILLVLLPSFADAGHRTVTHRVFLPPAQFSTGFFPAGNTDPLPNGIDISKGEYYDFVKIDWNKFPNAIRYEVDRRRRGSKEEWERVQVISNGNTQWRDDSAEEGIEYDYRIRVLQIDEQTRKAIEVETLNDYGYRRLKTASMNPPKQAYQAGDGDGDGTTVTLGWEAVPRATFYRLQILKGTSQETAADHPAPAIVDDLSELLTDTPVAALTYRFEMPDDRPDVIYYYRVRAENDTEISPFTPLQRIRKLEKEKPLAEQKAEDQKDQLISLKNRIELMNKLFKSIEEKDQSKYLNIKTKEMYSGNWADLPVKVNTKDINLVLIDACLNRNNTSQVWQLSKDRSLLVSAVLSPDGDGLDDQFRLFSSHALRILHLSVHGQAGDVVYQTRNIQVEPNDCIPLWDGQTADGALHKGRYLLFFKASTPNGKVSEYISDLEVIK